MNRPADRREPVLRAATPPPQPQGRRRLVTILCADAASYTRLMREDEEEAVQALQRRRAAIDGLVEEHGGRVFNTAGDSVAAEFASAVEAVRCAVHIQDRIQALNAPVPERRRMHFRIGLNLGDVIDRGGDLLGDGVNVAARLQQLARPGGILLSASLHDQVRTKLPLRFRDLGAQRLKNLAEPIHAYAVDGAGAPTRRMGEVAQMRWFRPAVLTGLALLLLAALVLWALFPASPPPLAVTPWETIDTVSADGSAGMPDASSLAELRQRGHDLLDHGQYGPATDLLAAALARAPDDAETLADYGIALLWSGRSGEALEHLERARRLGVDATGTGLVLRHLGLAYYLTEAYPAAARVLEEQLALQPQDIATALALAATYGRLGWTEDALHHAEAVRRAWPAFMVDEFVARFQAEADRARIRDGLRKAGLV